MSAASARDAAHAQRCFPTLSDESRRRLLDRLRAGEQCVGELRLASRRCD